MVSSPSSLSFCSARSFTSGLNSSGDFSSVKDDLSYAGLVRRSPIVVQFVHTSDEDVSLDDKTSYENVARVHSQFISTVCSSYPIFSSRRR